jgi:hypothetical protein
MKAMKLPIPAEIALLRKLGMELMIFERSGEMVIDQENDA